MQIRIAICDDEISICNQLEDILVHLLKERNITYEINVFGDGETLGEDLVRMEYDLLFLDIELPRMNGIAVGTYIRETLRNDVIQIAYISGKQEYAMELFEVRPIHFLIKPLETEKVANVLDTYIKINGGKNDVFRYQKGHEFHKIPIYKILYFIRESRKVIMYTADGQEEFYDSLEKIYDQLKPYGFLFIHKSYMINYRYIQKIGYDHVVMSDGKWFSISQSRRSEIRDQYWKLEK